MIDFYDASKNTADFGNISTQTVAYSVTSMRAVDFSDISKQLAIQGKYKSAKELSTLKAGGIAYTFMPTTIKEVVILIAYLTKHDIPFALLGGGSNTLISDGICKMALVDLKQLNGVKRTGGTLSALAGTPISTIINEGRKHQLGGLEFLSGIPARLGGAIRMNAGAFSSQTADYLHTIDILSLDNAICDKFSLDSICSNYQDFITTVTPQKQALSYRQGIDKIILSATLKLDKINKQNSIKKSHDYLNIRKQTQPPQPSLGCVFKNSRIPSGKLIEECGLKGYKKGGAMISDVHANFIVNLFDATANDYLTLKDIAKERVYNTFDILMQEEFKLIT